MFRTKLLKWCRKLHKWIGVYVSILTAIWLVEMVGLPTVFNHGLPTVGDGPPSSLQYGSVPPLSLEQALQFFMDQQPDGIDSAADLDEIAYLPANGVFRFAIKEFYLEWYVEAKTGKILKYGFDSNRFVMEKGMLGWVHPVVAKVVRVPFEFLFIFLAITGCYVVFYPRRKKKKQTGSVLDMTPGESRYFKEIKNTSLMGRLAAVGLLPGVKIQVIRSSGKGPVVIGVRKTYLALGRDIAAQIMISKAKI